MAPWFTRFLSSKTWETFLILLSPLHPICNPSASPIYLLPKPVFMSVIPSVTPPLPKLLSQQSPNTRFSLCSTPTLLHKKSEGTSIVSDRVQWLLNTIKYKWLPLAYKPGGPSSAYLSHLISHISPHQLLSFSHTGLPPFPQTHPTHSHPRVTSNCPWGSCGQLLLASHDSFWMSPPQEDFQSLHLKVASQSFTFTSTYINSLHTLITRQYFLVGVFVCCLTMPPH